MKNKQKATLILVVSCLYLLSPLDFCPDFLPGLGNCDDLLVMLFGTSRYFSADRVIEIKK